MATSIFAPNAQHAINLVYRHSLPYCTLSYNEAKKRDIEISQKIAKSISLDKLFRAILTPTIARQKLQRVGQTRRKRPAALAAA